MAAIDLKPGSASAEWETIVEHIPVLIESITSNTDHIANVLYSKKLLSRAEYHSIIFIESTPSSKAQRIVVAVETKVKVNQQLFAVFVAVLQDQQDDLIRQCSDKLSEIYEAKLKIATSDMNLQVPKTRIGFSCPYCNLCSMEEFFKTGCSKASLGTAASKTVTLSFPFLDTKNLTRKEELLLYEKLCADFSRIRNAFYQLCVHLSRSEALATKIDDVKSLLIICSGVNAKDRDRLVNAATVRDVITNLCLKQASFYNYEIIERIVREFGSKDDSMKLDQYLNEFHQYCRHSVFEVPVSVLHPGANENGSMQFALKYLEEGQFDLNQVKSICIRVAGILRINPWDLYLLNIEKGCILLHMMVSEVVARKVIPISFTKQEELKEEGLRVVDLEKECNQYSTSVPRGGKIERLSTTHLSLFTARILH